MDYDKYSKDELMLILAVRDKEIELLYDEMHNLKSNVNEAYDEIDELNFKIISLNDEIRDLEEENDILEDKVLELKACY